MPNLKRKWKDHNVYNTVGKENQNFITLIWANSKKIVDEKAKVDSSISSDSPACSKESMCLILNIDCFSWSCQSILNIKQLY